MYYGSISDKYADVIYPYWFDCDKVDLYNPYEKPEREYYLYCLNLKFLLECVHSNKNKVYSKGYNGLKIEVIQKDILNSNLELHSELINFTRVGRIPLFEKSINVSFLDKEIYIDKDVKKGINFYNTKVCTDIGLNRRYYLTDNMIRVSSVEDNTTYFIGLRVDYEDKEMYIMSEKESIFIVDLDFITKNLKISAYDEKEKSLISRLSNLEKVYLC